MPDERERIAQQLHDVVAARLLAVTKRLDAVLPMTADPDVQRRIGNVTDELHAVIADVRTTILELQRGDDDPTSVEGQLRPLVLNAGQQLGCTPRVTFAGPLDTLGPALIENAVAVAGEALTNVVRHAYAGTLDVSVTLTGRRLTLEVRDDGVGPNDEPTDGTGLLRMRERAEALGGTFTIEPNEPMGTAVTWSVPVS
jgi:signal transduction histidine kinase